MQNLGLTCIVYIYILALGIYLYCSVFNLATLPWKLFIGAPDTAFSGSGLYIWEIDLKTCLRGILRMETVLKWFKHDFTIFSCDPPFQRDKTVRGGEDNFK